MLSNLLNFFISILRETAGNDIFIIVFGVVTVGLIVSLFFRLVRHRF